MHGSLPGHGAQDALCPVHGTGPAHTRMPSPCLPHASVCRTQSPCGGVRAGAWGSRSSCGAGILSDEAFPPLCWSPAAARSHGTEHAKAAALLIAVATLCRGLWSQPPLTDGSPDVGDAGGLRSRRVSGGAGPGIRAGAPMLAPCRPLVNAAWPESRHSWARRLPSVRGVKSSPSRTAAGTRGLGDTWRITRRSQQRQR